MLILENRLFIILKHVLGGVKFFQKGKKVMAIDSSPFIFF